MGPRHKLLPILLMVLAAFFGTASIALFALTPVGSLCMFEAQWPLAGVLCWDGLLCFVFFLQHSGMVRRGFRGRADRFIAPRYYPAVYTIASGIALGAIVFLWQPSGHTLLVFEGVPLRVTQAGALIGFAFFFWGALVLKGFDPFGLSPIRDYLKGRPQQRPVFVVRGPYRWVRHPLYFGVLLLFWTYPEVTLDRLLFDVLWTGWIWMGTRLEEGDLENEFGDVYREYRRRVPMLVPYAAAFSLMSGRRRE